MRKTNAQRGQVIMLVTFSCFLLFGMMALAVDLGWAHYNKKSAQAASDASALAAAQQALYNVGQTLVLSCGVGGLTCQATTPCGNPPTTPPATDIDTGCLYAQTNGFVEGGGNGRQHVSIQADVTNPVPTVAGVQVDYWVTTRVSQTLPMLFGSIMGSALTTGTRSTAAIVDISVSGSLILLNQENDCINMDSATNATCGVDLEVSANNNQGVPALRADGGIIMASQKNGTSADGRYAGENSGGGAIQAGYTNIRGSGSYVDGGSSTWTATPKNGYNGNMFADPMRGKGQPEPPTGLRDVPVAAGNIYGGTASNPIVLTPGNYYAVDNRGIATGGTITISGYVTFSGGGSNFGNYVFYGGVNVTNPGTTVTFGPGRYIFAGVQRQGSNPGTLFSVGSNATIQDQTASGSTQTDAGEIFVFTDTNYQGQGQSLQIPPAISQTLANTLQQGVAGFQAGNNSASITVHGLNQANAALPSDLQAFSPVVMWQDQQNSVIKYTSSGNLDTSCGNANGCPNTRLANSGSPQLALQGSPSVSYNGTVYQPRGAWTTVTGGGTYSVPEPVQLISGSLKIQGSANFSMAVPNRAVSRRIVALIE